MEQQSFFETLVTPSSQGLGTSSRTIKMQNNPFHIVLIKPIIESSRIGVVARLTWPRREQVQIGWLNRLKLILYPYNVELDVECEDRPDDSGFPVLSSWERPILKFTTDIEHPNVQAEDIQLCIHTDTGKEILRFNQFAEY